MINEIKSIHTHRNCINCKTKIDVQDDEYVKLNTEVVKLKRTSLRRIMDYRRNYIYLCKNCAIRLLMDREPFEEEEK